MRKTIEVLKNLGMASSSAQDWLRSEGPWFFCKWPDDNHHDTYTLATLDKLEKEGYVDLVWHVADPMSESS